MINRDKDRISHYWFLMHMGLFETCNIIFIEYHYNYDKSEYDHGMIAAIRTIMNRRLESI